MAVNLNIPKGNCFSLFPWSSGFIAFINIQCVMKITTTYINEITLCGVPKPSEVIEKSWNSNKSFNFSFRLVFGLQPDRTYRCINLDEYQFRWAQFISQLDVIKSSIARPVSTYWTDSLRVLCQPAQCVNNIFVPAVYGNQIIERKIKIDAEPIIVLSRINGYGARCVFE